MTRTVSVKGERRSVYARWCSQPGRHGVGHPGTERGFPPADGLLFAHEECRGDDRETRVHRTDYTCVHARQRVARRRRGTAAGPRRFSLRVARRITKWHEGSRQRRAGSTLSLRTISILLCTGIRRRPFSLNCSGVTSLLLTSSEIVHTGQFRELLHSAGPASVPLNFTAAIRRGARGPQSAGRSAGYPIVDQP